MIRGMAVLTVFFSLVNFPPLPDRFHDKADFALVNGRVFTGSTSRPWVEAVACRDGRIVATGTRREIEPYLDSGTRFLDAEGHLVIPGFIDSHTHFAEGGRSLVRLDFRGVDSIPKIRDLLEAKIRSLPPGTPVFGNNYDQTLFPGGKWPTAADLDSVSPINPVVIHRVDGHSAWVNTLVLKASGIDRNTSSPFGGEIIKDSSTGEPIGILTEAAMRLIKFPSPAKDSASLEEDILRAIHHAGRLGLTGVHTSATRAEWEIYRKLENEGRLTLRIYAWRTPEDGKACAEAGSWQIIKQDSEILHEGFLKSFIDGSLGSRTAWMFSPYSDDAGTCGLNRIAEPEFDAFIVHAQAGGFQTGTHAIGDRGVHAVLDAIEKAQKAFGGKNLRHRIEHAQIIVPEDVARFKELGVVAAMQPTHCTTDLRFCEARIGKERSKNAYLWRTLLRSGATIAFGTDWPVEPLDPMRGLYSAVTRMNIEERYPEGGWFPEERISMEEALKAYTIGSAFAAFEENVKGTIETGKYADMAVLSHDLFSIPAGEILTTEVLFTILGGRIVYRKP